ncbi:MAG: hypothetical protein HOV67_20150 [Kribbellaceae bacterium]|nr:hypothetical protein [Kribbellaceae bacterium]
MELAAHSAVGAVELRRALVTAAYLVASQPATTERSKIDAAIGRIARGSIDGVTEPSVIEDTVLVFTMLGVTLAHRRSSAYAIRTAQTG